MPKASQQRTTRAFHTCQFLPFLLSSGTAPKVFSIASDMSSSRLEVVAAGGIGGFGGVPEDPEPDADADVDGTTGALGV